MVHGKRIGLHVGFPRWGGGGGGVLPYMNHIPVSAAVCATPKDMVFEQLWYKRGDTF